MKKQTIKLVAFFEFLKGTVVIMVSLLLFFDIGHIHRFVAEICRHMQLGEILAFAFLYTSLRYVEGYGLWKARKWGATLGILSTALYLPFEVYEIGKDPSVIKVAVTILNLSLLAYLVFWKRKLKSSH